MTTRERDSDLVEMERKWYQRGEVSIRKYKRLLLVHLYNKYMDGVDVQDQLRWYYRFDGKKMWRTRKWTWSMFLWVLSTAVVQAYITHLVLVRKDRVEFDRQHSVWEIRRSQLRVSAATGERSRTVEQSRANSEASLGRKRPTPTSHLESRIELARSLAGMTTDTQTPKVTRQQRDRDQGRPPHSAYPDMQTRRLSKKPCPHTYHTGAYKSPRTKLTPNHISV